MMRTWVKKGCPNHAQIASHLPKWYAWEQRKEELLMEYESLQVEFGLEDTN